MQGRFANRQEAGLELAKKLAHLEGEDVVVLGLARGGVVVAAEVAKALCAPLEAFVARKLGVPWQPELGFGAVAEGVRAVQEDLVRRLSLSREDIERVAMREEAEAARRVAAYLGDRPRLDLREKLVVLIDDGLATGITAIAAARAIRLHAPARLVFAAPVCSLQGAAKLREEVDEVVCVIEPENMMAVGAHYDDFSQITDQQVIELLADSD